MAHFAKLGSGNIVETVHVVHNNVATTEQAGVDFLNNLYNTSDTWFQTYKDGSLRKNYAGVGYTYNQTKDAFIPSQLYASWTLNETTCLWEAPVAYPDDGKRYEWNETDQNWQLR
jgi:hypothetical protein